MNFPAYDKEHAADFIFEKKGLRIVFSTSPYVMDARCKLTFFSLSYNPKRFWFWNIIKRTFGWKSLLLTEKDVRYVMNTAILMEDGDFVEIYLKDPKNPTIDNGPLLLISRDTGWVWFYPQDKKNMLLCFIFGLTAELQNHCLNKLGRNRVYWSSQHIG